MVGALPCRCCMAAGMLRGACTWWLGALDLILLLSISNGRFEWKAGASNSAGVWGLVFVGLLAVLVIRLSS